MDTAPTDSPAPLPPPRRGFFAWLQEGARTLVFLRPRLAGLEGSPMRVGALVALTLALAVAIQRLAVDGPAQFWWRAIYALAIPLLLNAALAWGFARARRAAPGPGEAFTLLCAQGVAFELVALLSVAGARLQASSPALGDALGVACACWIGGAWIVALARLAPTRFAPRALAAVAVVGAMWVLQSGDPVAFWYDAPDPADDAPPLALTQEEIEAQPGLLADALDGLAPQRPGIVDLYAITFAPYASQDVFMRESAMVADVMSRRFEAEGRVVQLVNNAQTLSTLPWATPLNLQRAIQAAAQHMDRDEDVLFIHLTSHGGADGELAMDFDPLDLDPVTPQDLKDWLDEAGVRWRVISISACYSGSWVEPLADDGTLVMTAADADHTSYGCGSRSPLTFFGAAMYDEALRHDTRSFEAAFAQSRRVIQQRETAAGKDDGYSNPQVAEGEGIRRQLVKLEAGLAARESLAASAAK